MVSAIVPANGSPAKTSALSGVAGGDALTLERVDEVLETDGESCRFLDLVMDRDIAFFRLVYDLKRECLSFCGEVEVGVGFGLVCAHPDQNMVSPIVPANGHPAKTSALSGVAGRDAPTLERVDEVLETDGESCRFLDLVMDRDSAFFRLVYDFLDLVMDRDNAFFRLVYDLERECLSFCGEVEVGVGFGLVCAHTDQNMVSVVVPANGRPAKTSALSGVAGGDAPTLERVDEVLETDGESCRFLDLVMDRDNAFFRLVYDFLDLVMDRDNAFFRLVYDLERECLFFFGEVEVGVGFGLVWGWGLGLKQRMVELG